MKAPRPLLVAALALILNGGGMAGTMVALGSVNATTGVSEVELAPPEKLLEELPLGKERAAAVVKAREEVVNVLHGKDPRLMVVVGW